MPVKRNLHQRGVKTDTICPVCSRFDEDCGHLFFKCKHARACWRLLNMEHVRSVLAHSISGKDLCQKIWALKSEEQRIVIIFLWQWWSARNKSNAGERVASTTEVCSSVRYHLQNFQKLQKDGKRDNVAGTKKNGRHHRKICTR
ncbi:hypothetical protein QOZ80_4BG0340840 [Eleusine coracana subsp. coracana]|nr:hypothetical protein QOZ80_4BG0340840 [Eleusine coracana subsp. coracana]